MLELIAKFLSPEDVAYLASIVAAVVAFLAALAKLVGSASIVVALLRSGVPRLQAWADRTESRLDNKAVSALGSALSVVAAALDWCQRKLAHVALDSAARRK